MTSAEDAIGALVKRWHDANAAGDIDTVLPLMADAVVFPLRGHQPMTGRAAFETGLRTIRRTHRPLGG